jgi:CBS domain containing-hemolysin-like protein
MQQRTLDLEGSTTIRELETRYNIILPSEAEFETLAGFMLYQFGYIPKEKDHVEYGGRRFTVSAMDRNRIAMVTIEKLLDPKPQAEAAK